ncbi:ABC-type transport auxiliary lipoprotein family protein [Tahibacter amnicola]|uniref:ABC-type transport auxiliary lipoprotein family protein n=1 Tax=Tahibacter amnicola TaxID=2976241 RepID=A0ABY6BCC2_9GAMM|nr:ABC-type transport auxiliary lipoprotein family protein [Tahibacter amnicola]UXI65965.1 ABC-type transport auxiliary lipoprotein family protein [Tahibacter amnicola]
MIRALRPGFLAAILVQMLCACSLLGQRKNVELYDLAPRASPPSAHTPAGNWQIEVVEPQSLSPLLGTGILVSPSEQRLAIYRGARWTDAPTLLLQSLLVHALRAGGMPGAAGSSSAQRADYLLESDLRAFQAEYRDRNRPTVVIVLDARLIRVADGRSLASRTVSVEEIASTPALPQVILAFGEGADRLGREVAQWTVETLSNARSPAP